MKSIFLTALIALSATTCAEAATFCVNTGDELNAALNEAERNDQDDVIRVEIGTHTTSTHALESYQWQYSGGGLNEGSEGIYSLHISGGWSQNNNCASQTSNDPTATVLDARNIGPVFYADLRYGFTGTFTIKNLTLTRGRGYPNCLVNSFLQPCDASGISLDAWAGTGANLFFDNILVNNGSNASGSSVAIAHFYIKDSGILRVRNSIFGGNVMTAANSSSRGVEIRSAGPAVY